MRSLSSGKCSGGGFGGASFVGAHSKIVTSCRDGSFLLWDMGFGLLGRVAVGNAKDLEEKRLRNLVFCVSPNGILLAFSFMHWASVLVYDIETCRITMGFKVDFLRSIKALQFLPDSQTLAVLEENGKVCFVDIWTGNVECQIQRAVRTSAKTMALGADASMLVIISEQGTAYLYDVEKAICQHKDHREKIDIAVFKGGEDLQEYVSSARCASNQTENGLIVLSESRKQRELYPDLSDRRARQQKKKPKINPFDLKVGVLGFKGKEVNRTQLRTLLHTFGEYPEKYRLLIWEFLMDIPHNNAAFEIVSKAAVHPAYQTLDAKFSGLGKVLSCRINSILSYLANWCPLFGEVPFLPSLVFPWVKLFGDHKRTCFEVIITILCNWGRNWFEQFPRPSMHILVELEELTRHHDPQLFNTLSELSYGPGGIAWKLLTTLMSEVVRKLDWLVMWDHALTNKPHFLHFLIISYMIFSRQRLMALQSEENVDNFLRTARPVNMQKIVSQAYALQDASPKDIVKPTTGFQPLGEAETYPEFNRYPCLVVSTADEKRRRIQGEEEALMRRRWILNELREKTLQLEADKKDNWVETIQAKNFADQVSTLIIPYILTLS